MNQPNNEAPEKFANEKSDLLLKKRVTVAELSQEHFGSKVVVAGFLKRVKDLGKLKFLMLADESGEIQLTVKDACKDIQLVAELTPQTCILAEGEVCQGRSKSGREIVVSELFVLGEAAAQPVPIDTENIPALLDSRLDFRWVDLRNPNHRFPLTLLSEFTRYSTEFFFENGFTEIFTPKFTGSPTESGAELFTVPYFGKTAYLAQSPQFYKQMAICSGFEKVFEIAPVFRANPSFTTRHDTEFTSLDMEIAYISSHFDVMECERKMLEHTFRRIKEKWGKRIKEEFKQEIAEPSKVPKISMEEAYGIVSKSSVNPEGDLNPEGERELSKYVKEKYDSDFVFLTDFPRAVRPFYHMLGKPMSNGVETTKSFDLIYRGVEITTGAQREHRYHTLIRQAEQKNLAVEKLDYYFNFFKYGAPPHGGLGLSPTRVIMLMLGLENVREATFIPRDPKRLFP
jgi:aspartyl-tRNA synthetase